MEVSKINAKTTKAELIEIIKEQEAALKAREGLVDDPVKEMEKVRVENVMKSAASAVQSGIFSDDITNKYNNVVEATELKQKELKELYGIETNANTLVALINGNKEKKVALEQEMAAKKADLEKEYVDRKAVLEKEIHDKEAEKKELLEAIKKEASETKAAIEKERKREEEEYQYNLSRQKKEDADKWADEKAEREKAIANLERIANANMEEFMKKADYLAGLEAKVASIPDLIAKAEDEAYAKGKAEADRSHAFEIRNLKSQNEYAIKNYVDKIAYLETEIDDKDEQNRILQEKVDESYTRIANMATTTAQATGGVKIISGEKVKSND